MPGTQFDVTTPDGTMDCLEFLPSGKGPWPGVVLFPDAFGVRPAMQAMAQRLCSAGYAVVLPNVLYREGKFAPFDAATAFTNPPERERLMKMVLKLDEKAFKRDTGAMLDAFTKRPSVKTPLGVVGYCLGGRLATLAAGLFAERVAAAASIHGGHLVKEGPESPHIVATRARAKLYFAVADNDRSCTKEDAAKLDDTLDQANIRFEIEHYEGAAHGFAVKDFPVYNEEASEKHWVKVLALFKGVLQRSAA